MLYFVNAKIKHMDVELKEQLDRMEKFMFGQLATKQELSDISEKLTALTESVSKLTTAVDNLAKRINDFDQEHKALKHQVTVMQDWIRKASEKIGIDFKL